MFNIKTLNKISAVGLEKFDKSKYVYGDGIENPDAIMVRSAAMHDMEMPKSLLAIARAGAGVNNTSVAGVRCFGGVQLAAAAKARIDKPLLL